MIYKEQVARLDCGLAIIQVIHKYFYDDWLEIRDLKEKAKYNKYGISINDLEELSKQYGIQLKSLRGDFNSFKCIKTDEPFVAIINNENFLHYVVIEKITNKNEIVYFDPVVGKKRIRLDEFENLFSGYILLPEKISYRKETIEKDNIIDLFKIDNLKEQMWISFCYLFVILLSFIGSFYLKIILDQIVPSFLVSKLIIVSLLFILISILKIVIGTSAEFITNRIQTKYQVRMLNLYIDKLERVDWMKVSHYDESDHLKNIELISKILSFKTTYYSNLVSQIACLLFSSIILLILDLGVFMASFISSILIVTCSLYFQKKFKLIEYEMMVKTTNFKRSFLSIINGLEQYKLSSTKQYLNSSYNKSVTELMNKQIHSFNTLKLFTFIQSLIKNIVPFIIVIISINKVWFNDMSVGQVFLFFSVYGFFINSFTSLASLIIDIPIMKRYVEEINSFFDLSNETNGKNQIAKIESIHLRNISFKYENGANLLKISDLLIKSKINVVGKNGSGKSTLLKIIASLINGGEIFYNELQKENLNHETLRDKIYYIPSSQFLPSSTIYNYLLANNKDNISYFLNNVEKYQLNNLFEKMNLKFSDFIEDGGKNLSSGQKQFLALMKIFSNDYSVLMFDESFENIDSEINNELFKILRNHLKDKIVIEISHRKNYLFNEKEVNCENFK